MKTDSQNYVVLLHGMGRDKRVMDTMEKSLLVRGYDVYNGDYQSTAFSIDVLADYVWEHIRENCPDPSKKLNFVGHSMGAIIIRLMIAKYQPENVGRVVMLGPPNQGSRLVNFLKRFDFYKRWYGPAGQELGYDSKVIGELPPSDYEFGVIAGDRSIDWLFSWFLLPGKNDGKLTVDETKLAGMRDHIILHATHTFMPSNAKVIQQTAHFLQHGYFLRK